MSTASPRPQRHHERIRRSELALPPPGAEPDQDEEWCVVRRNGAWRRVRLHDQRRHVHRMATDGRPLHYRALVCRKGGGFSRGAET